MLRSLLILIVLALSACATSPSRTLPRWLDAAALAEAQAALCELVEDCADLRIELLDIDRPVAEIRARFHIVLSRGLWQRSADAGERRFVLAHELGHRALDHSRPRDHAARLPQELEADGWAAARLCVLGHSPAAGRALLQRLHDEVEQIAAEGGSSADDTATTLRETALNEYRRRIAALPGCSD